MHSTIIPAMRYRDARAAIGWLVEVFGFREHLVVPGGGDDIIHAQLSFGGGMVMLSSIHDSAAAALFVQPDEVACRETQCACIIVADADEVYRRVKALGGKILIEIADADYGGRGFSCADPEGHIWHVGTYDPWAES